MADILTGLADNLGKLMSRISEDAYSAGWLHDIEWVLWRALLKWREVGRERFVAESEFGEDVAVFMWELDWLQRRAGGWVWWLDGMRFVPEERWLRLVGRRAQHIAHENRELDREVRDAR